MTQLPLKVPAEASLYDDDKGKKKQLRKCRVRVQ